MKKSLGATFLFLSLCALPASAQRITDTNPQGRLFMARGLGNAARPSRKSNNNLQYHNGPIVPSARVVTIFWGPSWATGGSDASTASTIRSFVGQFGTTAEYDTITQYYETGPTYISLSNLGNGSWNDTSTPPSNVTDADVQSEVVRYLTTNHVSADPSTIYEVYLPATSYASYGSSDSCGGPNLQFCAYHNNFNHNGVDVKYSSMPYPSCGGCQETGWTAAQDFTMFTSHETREAVTDPDGNAWYDRRGYEADDKCAWTDLFLDNGYGYQPEWSNAAGGCVRTTP